MVFIPPGLITTLPVLRKRLPSGERIGDVIVRSGRDDSNGGSSRRFGGGTGEQARNEREAARREAERRAAERRAAIESARIAKERAAAKALALQKAQDEAAAKLASALAKRELNKIIAIQQNIIKNRGSITQKRIIDAKTKNVLNVTTYHQNGNTVKRSYNTKTGEIKFFALGRTRNGGGKIRTRVTLGGGAKTASQIAANVSIKPSSNPNKVVVTFPNGRTGTINARGKVVVGANLAGKKYLFENGVIIAVDGKTTFARDEFVPVLEVQPREQPTKSANKIIAKLNDLQKKTSTSSVRNQQNELKNELSLLGLTIGTTIINGVVGFVAIGRGFINLIRNPSNIKKLPGILKQIPGAISRGGKSFGQLIRVSPTEAIGVIAGEIILFKGTGLTFKATGKVSSKTAMLVKPAIRKADRIVWKITGNTIKLGKKSKVIRKVVSKVKKVKAIQKAEIKKFKSAVEYSKDLKRARSIRRLARKKGRTINIGNRDFIEGVAFVEDTADRLALIKAKQFLKEYKARGGKLGLGQEEQFIQSVRRLVKNNLNEYSAFKRLKEYSKFTKPYQIKLLKNGKFLSAKKLSKTITSKIKNLSISKKANSLLKKLRTKATKLDKLPSRIKKRLALKKLKRVGRREFRKTNRYRMEKTRKIRKVSLEQLNRSKSVNSARKFVDDFFDEFARRQKVPTSNLKYRQFKNTIKKRISWAIKRGDVTEINKFKASIRKIIRDMNKPSKSPVIKVIQKGKKTRSVRTIKDFKPEAPKGKYVEVKSGQQVLLEEVKQVQRIRQVQKLIQKPQVFIIMSVQKQSISLAPLLQFGVFSLSALAFKTLQKQQQKLKSGQALSTKQIARVIQDSAQDFKVLQSVAQDVSPRLKVAQRVAQDVASRLKTRQRLVTKQVTKKPPVIPRKIKKPKNIRTLPKKVMTYAFIVKKSGKNVRLKIPPMTLRDSWDVGAFRLDHDLQRTGTLIPVGMTKKVAVISKKIKGYYGKHQKKFRRFRIKKGKKFTLKRTIIEKKKYVGDLRSEQIALKRARASAKRRGKTTRRKAPVKRKGNKRSVTRPLKRLAGSVQRRRTIARLKKQNTVTAKRNRLMIRRPKRKIRRKPIKKTKTTKTKRRRKR